MRRAALLLLALALAVTAHALGLHVLAVRSGSMQPAIGPGDLVIARAAPAAGAVRGDVVTFADPGRGGRWVTHRVTGVEPAGNGLMFHTRGDANPAGEAWSVPAGGTVLATVAVVALRGPASAAAALLAAAVVVLLRRER
jgi:signal peptidase